MIDIPYRIVYGLPDALTDIVTNMLGADGLVKISTDAQDLSATLTVDGGSSGLDAQGVADALKLAPNAMGDPAPTSVYGGLNKGNDYGSDTNSKVTDIQTTVATLATEANATANFAKLRSRISTMRIKTAEIGIHRIAAARNDDGSFLSTSSILCMVLRMADNYTWNGTTWGVGPDFTTFPEYIPPTTPPGAQGIHYADVNFSQVGFYYVKFAVLAASPASGWLEEGEIWEIVATGSKAAGTKGTDAIYDKAVSASTAAKILVQNSGIVHGKTYYYNATIVDYLGKPIVPDAAPQLYCFKNSSTIAQFQATMKKRGSDGGRFYMDKVVDSTYEMGAQYLFVTKATVGGVAIESSETIRFEDTKKIDYIYSKETKRP